MVAPNPPPYAPNPVHDAHRYAAGGAPLVAPPAAYGPPPMALPAAPVGFFGGAAQFFVGLGFLLSRPSLYGIASVPLFVASAVTTVGFVVSWFAAGAVVAPHLAEAEGVAAAALHVAQALLFLTFALFSVLLGATLAQPLSGPALERLVARTEETLGVVRDAAAPKESLAVKLFRSLRVNLFGLGFAVITLGTLALLTFLFPPISVVTVPLKFCATALVVAWDFLDYPLEVRGGGVRKRLAWFMDHFGAAFGFGLAATGTLLLPFVGLIVLPAGVVGATHLVARARRARP